MSTYFQHMMGEEESIMSKYYGLYKVKLAMMEDPITFVLMDSLINKDYSRVAKTRKQRERACGTPRNILRNTQAQTQHQTTKFNK